MKRIWELQKKSQLTSISNVKVILYQLKNNGLVVLLKESQLPMQIPPLLPNEPFHTPNSTDPSFYHTSLVFFSALLSLFLSIIYQAHGTHHHQNCFLEPSHRRHLSSWDSGRGKNGIQVPIHKWKTKLLRKKMRKKKHQKVRYVEEPTSLETLCHHLVRLSYTNLHSAIPPEDVCPWETCTHCPRHIHENIHSSILRNQN